MVTLKDLITYLEEKPKIADNLATVRTDIVNSSRFE